jgi:ATP/maltotriose-dependent transcriptional regulator MalT
MVAARAGRFWDWRGSLAEAVTWTDRFMDAVDDPAVPAFAILVSWAGYFAWELGEADRAEDLIARAVSIATEQHDEYGRAIALTGSAIQARVNGDAAGAVKIDGDIREIAEAIGDAWLAAWADNHDGLSLLGLQDLAGAAAAGEASLRGFRDLGDRRATGWALTVLAQIAHDRADHPKVVELAEEAAALSRAAGDGRNAAWALELAAEAANAAGDEATATRLASDAADLLRERGVSVSPWRRP